MRLSVFVLALCTVFQLIPQESLYTPKNLIIATDLDNVVLRHRYGVVIFSLLKNSPRLMQLYIAYRKEKDIYRPLSTQWGEGFYLFLQDQKDNPFACKIVKMLNAKKRLHTKTVRLYKKIADKGYNIFTASNIDSISYGHLQHTFPDVFHDGFIQHGMTVDLTQKEMIKKPDRRYFEELKRKLNPNGDMFILFIDDLAANVEAARAAGLLAIQYKNPKQLQKELLTYGIILD